MTDKVGKIESTVQNPEQSREIVAMDRLQAMSVFARVVESGNFTRAADRLRLPKATVTTLIQNLETHLGAKLLNRTTRRVSVTADGAAYYERCVRILSEVEETEQALSRTRASPRGRLRVDVPGFFGRGILVPALAEFFARYPDIHLELGCSDRPVDLLEEGVDCVVRGGHTQDPALVARRIADLEFVTCAHADYIERYGRPEHPQDLLRHQCISYFSAKTGKVFEWDFSRGEERLVLPVEGCIALNDGDAYLAAGLNGLGIMQAPIMLVGAQLAAGELIRLLEDWRIDSLPLYVMYPQNRHLSAKVRVFVDWVSDVAAGWARGEM
jgi:LysR family transcriptional regulator, regulator for bpeEF and oprC